MSWLEDFFHDWEGDTNTGQQDFRKSEIAEQNQSPPSDGGFEFDDNTAQQGFRASEISESIAMAFGGADDYAGYTTGATENAAPRTAEAGGMGGVIDKASGWIDKHQNLTKLGLGLIAGTINGNSKKDAAEALAASRLAELREQDRLKQERNAAFSQSVSGLRKPGLIGTAQPFKRRDGTNVFNNGQLAR